MLARQTTGWVGFDIGAASVKAVQIVRADGGYRIRAAALVPRSERWPLAALGGDPPRSSADEISAAASLCEHLAGSSAATLLPVGVCEMLQMDAPVSKRTGDAPDLVRAIEAETQHSMRDRIFDYWPTAAQAGKFNVITAPAAWSDRISADVASSGWNCKVIDALPWALARAASLAGGSPNGRPIAALDWAYGKSTVCLVHGGAPLLVRSLKDCSYLNVISDVASNLRLSEQDAAAVLQRFGLRGAQDGAADAISDVLEQPLRHLAQELRRTFDYWRGVTRGQTPESMYIFGGGGALAGVGARLTEMLGMPARAWELPVEKSAGPFLPPPCLFGAAAGLSALAWEAA